MNTRVRLLLSLIAVLATMGLAACGHYNCGATFGNSTCSSSGGGLSSGGGNTSSGDAFLYVADAGGVQGMTVDASAGTIVNNCTPATCPSGIPATTLSYWTVIAQEKYLYVGYPGLGAIYGWTIASDGALASISGSPFSASYWLGSTLGGSQEMITNPAGTLLFVLEPSGNALYEYAIGAGGVLSQVGSPVTLPFLPENLAIDGLGKYLYVSNSVGGCCTNQINGYKINSDNSLTLVPGSPFTSNGLDLNYALVQMQGDPTGKFMIGTTSCINNCDPNIYVLSIGASGAIAAVPGSPFPTTNSPTFVTVQPGSTGTLVYSFTVNGSAVGGQVEGFTLNPSSGALTAVSGSPFAVTGDYGQFDQSGDLLFVRDLFNLDMSIYSVSSGGTLAQSVASVGWGPGSWAPTDIP
jgi:6-phosphogluconolactonase